MIDDSEVTIIGETILVTGSLRGDENLTVLGRVEGQINLSQTLLVAEGGIVKAEVNVDNTVISGVVVGNVTAVDCIQITQTGRVLGDVKARRIILDAGARVRGAIHAGNAQAKGQDRAQQGERTLQAAGQSVPTSLMARRQLSQQARLGSGTAPTPTATATAQEAAGGSSGQGERRAQEAMAMAVKKKVAGKKRG